MCFQRIIIMNYILTVHIKSAHKLIKAGVGVKSMKNIDILKHFLKCLRNFRFQVCGFSILTSRIVLSNVNVPMNHLQILLNIVSDSVGLKLSQDSALLTSSQVNTAGLCHRVTTLPSLPKNEGFSCDNGFFFQLNWDSHVQTEMFSYLRTFWIKWRRSYLKFNKKNSW